MLLGFVTVVLLALMPPQEPSAGHKVYIDQHIVALGDIFSADELHDQGIDRFADREILAIEPSRKVRRLSQAQLKDLILKAVPEASSLALERLPVHGLVFVRRDLMSNGVEAPCYTASVSLSEGDIVSRDRVHAVSCRYNSVPALRYDHDTQLLRAGESIYAGDYLGDIMPSQPVQVDRGDKVTLQITKGAVRVQKSGTAIQPARSGDVLTVRDAGGNVTRSVLVSASEREIEK